MAGGGSLHRASLSAAVLIKDNHIRIAGGVGEAVRRAKQARPNADVEVEGEAPAELDESTCNRCLKAADMYRQCQPCPVLVSGRSTDADGADYAETMRDFLVRLGVRSNDVIMEGHSLTTYENAVASCKLLQERHLSRILLITDAIHLKRAVACFRKQGMEVIPCGSMYRLYAVPFEFTKLLPQPGVAERCQRICHEWLGLAWYWWRGRI